MYLFLVQMLSRRFDFEKEKLEETFRIIKQAPRTSILPACCVFLPDMLCQNSSFNCWLEILPIADDASFFLDARLLQQLSTVALADGEEQCQVRFSFLNYIKYFLGGLLGTSSYPELTRGITLGISLSLLYIKCNCSS